MQGEAGQLTDIFQVLRVKPRTSISYDAYSLSFILLRRAGGNLSSVGEPKCEYVDTMLQLIMCMISSHKAAICM